MARIKIKPKVRSQAEIKADVAAHVSTYLQDKLSCEWQLRNRRDKIKYTEKVCAGSIEEEDEILSVTNTNKFVRRVAAELSNLFINQIPIFKPITGYLQQLNANKADTDDDLTHIQQSLKAYIHGMETENGWRSTISSVLEDIAKHQYGAVEILPQHTIYGSKTPEGYKGGLALHRKNMQKCIFGVIMYPMIRLQRKQIM